MSACGPRPANAGGHELGNDRQGTQGGGKAFVLHAAQVSGELKIS